MNLYIPLPIIRVGLFLTGVFLVPRMFDSALTWFSLTPMLGAISLLPTRATHFSKWLIRGLAGASTAFWLCLLFYKSGHNWISSDAMLFPILSMVMSAGLIGVTVGALSFPVAKLTFRRLAVANEPIRQQFTIRHLLSLTTVLSVFLAATLWRLPSNACFTATRNLESKGFRFTCDLWGNPKCAGAISPSVSDSDLKDLQQLQSLESLALVGSGVTDKGLVHLKRIHGLKAVRLPTGITDAGLPVLLAVPSLEYVDALGTQTTPTGLMNLLTHRNLKEIRIQDNVKRQLPGPPRAASITLTEDINWEF